MDNDRLLKKINLFADKMLECNEFFACAESCTGGWLSKVCTDKAGSSAWFDCGFVTYSNTAKNQMLGVKNDLINQHGAVSEAVAEAMVRGVIEHSEAKIAVAITGIAGPSGGSEEKPVGTVCFAFSILSRPIQTKVECFPGDREAVRFQAVDYVVSFLLDEI